MSSRETIVTQELTCEQALALLAPALAPTYEVTRTPAADELYVRRFPSTYVIVKLAPLSDGRTAFQVRADWGPAAVQWIYGHAVSSKRVARAIDDALNSPGHAV